MVVERGPEPMGEKGRGYGLARRYHYSQFQRRVRRRADGRKTGQVDGAASGDRAVDRRRQEWTQWRRAGAFKVQGFKELRRVLSPEGQLDK